MSWIQNLYETYEACFVAASIVEADQKKMLLPIGHALKNTHVVVYLRGDGTFISAEKSEAAICIPCTDDSESRTSTSAKDCPFPLSDQVKHVTGKKYADSLLEWLKFLNNKPEYLTAHKMISAVCEYIKRGTLKNDLETFNIKPDDKLFVRFCVNIEGQLENRLWMMPELWSAWYDYYKSEHIEKSDHKDLCYVSGEDNTTYTEKHPKSINRASGNAKLITGNDSANYTYRGRFEKPTQAVTVGYENSQKAHQALRWLIQNQSYRCDTQAIVAWAIDKMPKLPDYYDHSHGICASLMLTDLEKELDTDSIAFIDYANLMKKTLVGYGGSEKLKKHRRRVAVLATDSATTGRMSITYYRELAENEYLERIVQWHNTCNWYQPYGKDEEGKYKPGYFIGAPSFDRIVVAVIGKKRSQNDKSHDKLKKGLRERLLHWIFDGERIPHDMVTAAIHRASNPLAFEKTEVKSAFGRWIDWEIILCTACGLVKRYYHDYEKEEYEVALELYRHDRDYLYGRLLAVADKIESVARYKQDPTKGDARATNAIRYMTVFSQRPFRTWNMLFTQQLNPYIQQLNGAGWYLNQIEEIIALFNKGEYESDNSLNGKYILGFFAQRQALRQKKGVNNNDGGEDNVSEQ